MSTVCTFYAGDGISFLNLRFENDVKMYGTQTMVKDVEQNIEFENDVKMYGTQTSGFGDTIERMFENDVKMYGTQTENTLPEIFQRLRMM